MKPLISAPMHCIAWCRAVLGVVLVAGQFGAAWADALFTINSNGTVTDSTTHLVWDQCAYGLSGSTCETGSVLLGNWDLAFSTAAQANAVSYKGFSDWRVPNKNELGSIVDVDRITPAGHPAIDTTAFPNTPVNNATWSSTSVQGLGYQLHAWTVWLGYGSVTNDPMLNRFNVRLVRGGQNLATFDFLGSVPALSGVGIAGTGGNTTTLHATSSASGTGYWLVVPAAATAPTPAQIKAGASYTGATVAVAGSGTMTAAAARSFFVSGLAQSTAYALYLVVENPDVGFSVVSGPVAFSTVLDPRSFAAASPISPGSRITASFTGGSTGCAYAASQFSSATPPAGVTLPHGVFNFSTTDCGAGATLSFTITYPQALPPGTRYYKYGPSTDNPVNHWFVLSSAVLSTDRTQFTFTITDNGVGDANPADGFISDPGGPGVMVDSGGVAPIPTLSEWGMILLSGLLAMAGLRQMRRQKGRS